MADIAYLDRTAASPAGRDYKERLLDALELRPGLTVLDLGCGPGAHLGSMADRVNGDGGLVLGLDRDPLMVAEAARRFEGRPEVRVWTADAHALPRTDASVDRVRVDRTLQHVADPGRVLREIRRVLVPGGRVGLADPDWDTLAVADEDVATSRAYARYVSREAVRNASMGRELARLAAAAGLRVELVDATSVLFTRYEAATAILKLPEVTARAVAAGYVDAVAGEAWLRRLATVEPFVASVTFYVVAASA